MITLPDMHEPQLPPGATAVEREYHAFRWFLPGALVEGDLSSLQVTYMNRMACIIFGYTPEDVATGVTAAQLFAPSDFAPALQATLGYVANSRASGMPYDRDGLQPVFELEMRRKDGSLFPAELTGSFVLDSSAVPCGLRILVRDASHRRLAPAAVPPATEQPGRHMVSICPRCQRIGDDGAWHDIHGYEFHAARVRPEEPLCPDCVHRAITQAILIR